MKRHPAPKQPNTRVFADDVFGRKWEDLSCDDKRFLIATQLRQLPTMNKQPQITCLCGKTVPVMYAYRCFECGAFWCPVCARKHFS